MRAGGYWENEESAEGRAGDEAWRDPTGEGRGESAQAHIIPPISSSSETEEVDATIDGKEAGPQSPTPRRVPEFLLVDGWPGSTVAPDLAGGSIAGFS